MGTSGPVPESRLKIAPLPGWIEPIGTLWVNALRMTVIPLVVSAILMGVTSLPDTKTIGRIGGRAFVLFIASRAQTAPSDG